MPRLASAVGISGQTVARDTDLMVDLLLGRRLPCPLADGVEVASLLTVARELLATES